jgi:NADH-quinone oxidoreductase subunit J
MTHVAFFVVAAVAVAAALGLVIKRNPIHGALFLVVNLASVAALYLMLRAELLAAVQVIVYAGAIVVLFVFAIMVLIPGKEETGPDPRRPYRILALPVGALLLALLVGTVPLVGAVVGRQAPAAAPPDGVAGVARILFTDYLLPFELTGVLLLAAMVGVLVLARRRA